MTNNDDLAESNVIGFPKSKNLTRDDVIDQLERLQMASQVTLPAEKMEVVLLQLLNYMDAESFGAKK